MGPSEQIQAEAEAEAIPRMMAGAPKTLLPKGGTGAKPMCPLSSGREECIG
jgi:hypothetical protein